MDGVGDGGFGELVASPTADNKVPRQAVLDVLKYVRDEDARAFEGDLAVADMRVRHHVLAQFNAPRASFHVLNFNQAT